MLKKLFVTFLVLFAFSACKQNAEPKHEPKKEVKSSENVNTEKSANSTKVDDPLIKEALEFAKPLPAVMTSDEKSKLSPELIYLGKTLYHDPRLSKSGAISCNFCHNLASYGVDNRSTSLGQDFHVGGRNAPTVFNAALHISQFWDGRAKDVEEQAKGPVLNPVEMAAPSEEFIVEKLKSIPGYHDLFKKAYPSSDDPITYENMARAIGAFERTLVTPSKFDEFLNGNPDALNEQEKSGLKLFKSVGCTACHMGASLGGQSYQKFGAVHSLANLTDSDDGRAAVTKEADDKAVFKVPGLRNIEMTYPYFHNGSVWSLKESVKIMAKTQLGKDLTEKELEDITAFLKTLTGEIPEDALKLPVLPASSEKTSKPEPSNTLK